MSATALDRMANPSETVDRTAGLVLVRMAAGAAPPSTIARDLKPILSDFAATTTALIASLALKGLASEGADGRFAATAAGEAVAAAYLGLRKVNSIAGEWADVRDGALVLRALGLGSASAKAQKAVTRIDGLRLAIVERTFGLKTRGKVSASRARTALALLALERAFGNSVKGALGARTDLSPKAARMLAAQLSKTPKDYGTDARLVAALAAEAVSATKSDLASLRAGVVRRFLLEAETPRKPERRKRAAVTPVPGRDAAAAVPRTEATAPAPLQVSAPAQLPPHSAPLTPHPVSVVQLIAARPDPAQFAKAVLALAAKRAEGWPGNRRAFVSQVWALVAEQHARWQLSEIEFKSMLTEAHRTGLLVLANADLKDKSRLADFQASAIPYKNTVWHYIRVEG